MTDVPAHSDPKPAQETDTLPIGRFYAIGALTLLVFLAGVGAATAILRLGQAADAPDGVAPIPEEIGRAEIGVVFQPQFGHLDDGRALHRRQLRRLESYGWIDRPKGVVHLPVERAMDLWLAGELK